VYESARQQTLDAYTFFAVASRLHGTSLNWFAHQWAYARLALQFEVEVVGVSQTQEGFRTALVVSCAGGAIPGEPVQFYLRDEVGTTQEFFIDLSLGRRRVELISTGRPASIHPDPHCRWFAARTVTNVRSPQ
jgi:hypothetical protein